MQSGLENLPYFVPQNFGVPVILQQGINIVLAPSLSYAGNLDNDSNNLLKDNINNGATELVTVVPNDDGDDDKESNEQDDVENEDPANSLTNEEIECYKQKIYNHPLFALISFLFERCDQSTTSSTSPPVKTIDCDINNHFIKLHQEETPIFTEDTDVDNLMIEALKVFKIHLIELEKVQELCKDFCARYIRCLKTSMHSSQLVPMDPEDEIDANLDLPSSSLDGNSMVSPLKSPLLTTNLISPVPNLSQGQVVSGGTVYQMVQTPQGLVAQPIQIPTQMVDLPSPTSQMRADQQQPQLILNNGILNYQQHTLNAQYYSTNNDEDDNNNGGYQNKKSKRGVLPKKATKVMKAWLFQHLSHPYPNEDEKRQIASQTNLTMLQVNNWFINGRRRILQPMMNSSSSSSDVGKQKMKRQNKKTPMQRFWPPTSSSSSSSNKQGVVGEEEEEDEEDDNDDDTDDENDENHQNEVTTFNSGMITNNLENTHKTQNSDTLPILTFHPYNNNNNNTTTTIKPSSSTTSTTSLLTIEKNQINNNVHISGSTS